MVRQEALQGALLLGHGNLVNRWMACSSQQTRLLDEENILYQQMQQIHTMMDELSLIYFRGYFKAVSNLYTYLHLYWAVQF